MIQSPKATTENGPVRSGLPCAKRMADRISAGVDDAAESAVDGGDGRDFQ